MLVDSGSTHSFVSSALASGWPGLQQTKRALKVKIADGGVLNCDQEIPNCAWDIQGETFCTTLKLLPLGCYDIVLGMDWLQANSPMNVHWVDKYMTFMHDKRLITLQGVKSDISGCARITTNQLETLEQQRAVCLLIHLCAVKDPPLTAAIPPEILSLLQEFPKAFDEPQGLPPSRQFDHTIPLVPGAKPVNLRPYRYSLEQKNEIEAQVAEMLRQGIIKISCSPFASPALLVQKKDGTWHLCVDYRHLNAITVKNRFPIPVIDELLDELAGAVWFTSLDLRSGYHQIRMAETDEPRTAFRTHHGHYEYKVMPYGVTGGPATFQHAMNTILAPLLRRCVLVFIDDILIYSHTFEEHIQHLRAVLNLLQQHDLKLKKSKCTFAQKQLKYLGHVISAQGVATDPRNIEAVRDWPTPDCVKAVRGFLGLAGYYRKFVRNFGVTARILTDLLKKDSVFVWTDDHEAAFQALKQSLLTAPVLALPDFSKKFIVETDASD